MPIISDKRRDKAKKFSIATAVCLLASSLVFFLLDREIGLLAAIITSCMPSTVNLVDD
tara:strand:+ start:128 stop:301 length:174 start_codon:yes stop_codon:yes gene_type:complete